MTVPAHVDARRQPDRRRQVVLALAALEARRILSHPAPTVGLLLSVFFAHEVLTAAPSWPGAAYMSLPVIVGPLLCGISLAAAAVFAPDQRVLAEEAPVRRGHRALARLLAGVPAVAAVAVLTGAAALWLRAAGGLTSATSPAEPCTPVTAFSRCCSRQPWRGSPSRSAPPRRAWSATGSPPRSRSSWSGSRSPRPRGCGTVPS